VGNSRKKVEPRPLATGYALPVQHPLVPGYDIRPFCMIALVAAESGFHDSNLGASHMWLNARLATSVTGPPSASCSGMGETFCSLQASSFINCRISRIPGSRADFIAASQPTSGACNNASGAIACGGTNLRQASLCSRTTRALS
jgi:hypothetical protein